MESLINQTLGKYTIRREIGRGGMAAVFLGYQEDMDREVAIKVLPREFMYDQTFLERFKREARAIARMNHPRILPVHDFGEDRGWTYIVMAYMEGGSLADLIRERGGATPLTEVARVVRQISEALDYAHNRGVIHRDLKPSNVLLDEAGNAYLSDFGIAKIAEATAELTGSGVVGTPAYLAPEMARPGGLSPLVDIYALGVMLYQMLTGKQPYLADTPMGVMMAHVTQPIPNAREARPDLPAEVQTVIGQAMAKDPVDRYQTACNLADDFDAAIAAVALEEVLAAEEPSLEPFDETIPTTSTPPEALAEVEETAPETTPIDVHAAEKVEAPGSAGTVPSKKPAHAAETIQAAGQAETIPAAPGAAPTIPSAGKEDAVGDMLVPPEIVAPGPPHRFGKPWPWIAGAVGALAIIGVVALLALGVIGGGGGEEEASQAGKPEEEEVWEAQPPQEEEQPPPEEEPPPSGDEVAWGHYERAEQFMDREDWVAAIIELDQAIEINPNIPEFWHLRGVAHWRIGDDDQQAADYHTCIEVGPDYYPCYRNLGYVYLLYYQDFEQTMYYTERAIELDPRPADSYWTRGVAYRDLAGDWGAAIEYFTLAIEREPDDPSYYHERCMTYNIVEDYEAAARDCLQCVEMDENPWCFLDLGWALNGIGDTDGADEAFRGFLHEVPDDECPECHDDVRAWFEANGRPVP